MKSGRKSLSSLSLLVVVGLALATAHAAAPKEPVAKAGSNAKTAATTKAKPQVKAKTKAKTKAKPKTQTKAATSANPETPAPATDQAPVDPNNLDADVAAARRALAENPGDTRARERLARIAVVLVDEVLRAESVGNTGKAGELVEKLKTDLHDTGWRVQKMAQNGDLPARQATGFLLERGLLLKKDTQNACAEFLVAATQLAAAGWHAARCLMTASPDKAWVHMEQAAVKGHAAAQEWMGRRCAGEFGAKEKDYACARSWLAQSASQGRSRSQTLFAYLLMNGHGGAVDQPRAFRLYTLAAEQGDADAQNNLGEIYEMGHGTAPNPEEALRWYERAAAQGLSSAQFNAGRLLAIGIGEKKDVARARALLHQAEGNGVTQAGTVLKWLDQQSPPEMPAASGKVPAAAGDATKKE